MPSLNVCLCLLVEYHVCVEGSIYLNYGFFFSFSDVIFGFISLNFSFDE